MTNTAPASPEPLTEEPSFDLLAGDDGAAQPDPKDQALDTLQKQLAALQDKHREERFIWIVVCVILVDVLWFRNASNAVVPVIVLLLQVIILFILAGRLGIQEMKGLMERIIYGIGRSGTGG